MTTKRKRKSKLIELRVNLRTLCSSTRKGVSAGREWSSERLFPIPQPSLHIELVYIVTWLLMLRRGIPLYLTHGGFKYNIRIGDHGTYIDVYLFLNGNFFIIPIYSIISIRDWVMLTTEIFFSTNPVPVCVFFLEHFCVSFYWWMFSSPLRSSLVGTIVELEVEGLRSWLSFI